MLAQLQAKRRVLVGGAGAYRRALLDVGPGRAGSGSAEGEGGSGAAGSDRSAGEAEGGEHVAGGGGGDRVDNKPGQCGIHGAEERFK